MSARPGKPAYGRPTASACLEPLENRILFSADVFGLVPLEQLGQIEQVNTDDAIALLTDSSANNTTGPELIFIDSRLPQRALIIDDLLEQKSNGRDLDVVVIEPNQNGIDVISQSLAGSKDVSAVHVLSHGTNKGIQLGDIWLLESNVEFYLAELTEWSSYLADDADLLIYGCNLAGSDSGLKLLETLEQTTQADVAASSDITGHNNLGANWTLEHTSGDIEAQPVLTEDAQSAWEYEMAAFLANDDTLIPHPINTSFTVGDSINADENIIINDEYSGQTPKINVSNGPNNGTLTPDPIQPNTYQYTPDPGYQGLDSFEYSATHDPDIRYHWLLDDAGPKAIDQTATQNGDISGNLPFNGNDFVNIPSIEYPDSFTLSFDFNISPTISVTNSQVFYDQGGFGLDIIVLGAVIDDGPDPGTIHIWTGSTSSIYSFATQISGLNDNGNYEIFDIPYGNLNLGQWQNYTLTVNGTDTTTPMATVYIDGQSYGSTQIGSGGFNIDGLTSDNVVIGAELDGGISDHITDHGIRDFRIYEGVRVPTTDPSQAHAPLNYDTATVNIELQSGPNVQLISDSDITINEDPGNSIAFPIEVVASHDVTVTLSTKDSLLPGLQNAILKINDATASVEITGNSSNFIRLVGPIADVNAELATLTYTPVINYHDQNPLVDTAQDDLLTITVDGEVNRLSGQQRDGQGSPINGLFVADPNNAALGEIISLTNEGEHIEIYDYQNAEPDEITLAAWINLDQENDGAEIISFRDVAGLRLDTDGYLQGYANYNGTKTVTTHTLGPIDLEDDGWHHIAFRVYDGHQQLYLDGVRIGESFTDGALDYSGADNRVLIGERSNHTPSLSTGYEGDIDDVFIYQHALQSTEIEQLAQGRNSSVSISSEIPIRISPINDAPTLTGITTEPAVNENDTNYILLEPSGNISIEDVEAEIRGSYDGYSVTLQRSGFTWHPNETAPINASNSPNVADNFGAINNLIDSANGVVSDSDGVFGTIDQNSGGALKVTFEDTSAAVPVTKDRINSFLNSITYLNDDAVPPQTAEISWIFADNGYDNFGNTPNTNESAAGFSTVHITRYNSIPAITNNIPLTAYFTASNIITQAELLTQDDDHIAADLRYQLNSLPAYGDLQRTDGTVLVVADDFTQADIDSGVITYVAYPGTTNVSDQFLFSVFDGLNANVPNQLFSINVTSDPNNQPPALANIGAPVIFTEDGPPVAILGNANVVDVDSATLQSAEITLINGTVNDTLVLPNQASGITGTFTAGTLTLSKAGTPGTLAEYEAAIRSVTYTNSSQDPAVANPSRGISIVLDDGNSSGVAATRKITVVPQNDAPVIANFSGTAIPPVFTENGSAVAITDSLTITDIDDDNIEEAHIAISNNFSADDELYLPPDPVNYPNIISTPAPGSLTLSGSAPKSEYMAAIHSVEFKNTGEDPGQTDRTISIVINDGDDDSITLLRQISVNAVNDAPVISNLEPPSTPATYTENSIPVNITATATVADEDDTQIEFARVLLNNYVPGDTLTLDPAVSVSTGIVTTTTVTPTQIELRLDNTGSLTDYQSAIQAITFENSTHTPTNTTRTVEIILNDGDAPSAIVSRNIEVTAVNDPPTIAGIEHATSFSENDQPVDLTDTVTVEDLDDAQIEKAIVTITNYQTGEDFLTFSGHPDISSQFVPSTGTMTLVGPASPAAFEAAIGSISYINTSDLPNTTTRNVSIEVFDSDPTVPSNQLTRDIEIFEVPDLPEINGVASTPAVFTENGAATPLFGAVSTADLDDTDLVSAKITITNFVPGEDILEYTAPAGIIGVFDTNTGELEFTGTASHAVYDTALQSAKYNNSSSDPSTVDRTVSIIATDTTGEISLQQQRVVEIHAVDNNPILSNIGANISFTENGSAVPISTGVIVNDVDNVDIDSASITIENYVASEDELIYATQSGITGAFNTNNEFVLSGVASLANYQTALQSILYNNTSENPDTTTRTISITVANDLTSNTEKKELTINPVNDAPTLAISSAEATAATYTENLIPTQLTNSIVVDDIDNTQLTSATITLINPEIGDHLLFTPSNNIFGNFDSATNELILTGASSLANYQAAIRSITFESTSDTPTNNTRSVSIAVNDNNINSNTVTRDIAVNPTNDAPVVSNVESNIKQYIENSPPTSITDNATISDIESNQISSAKIIINNAHVDDHLQFNDQNGIFGDFNNSNKVLTLIGSASTLDYQSAIRSITFENISDDPSTNVRNISIEVNDGDGSNSVTRNISVKAVNDAPLVTNLETSVPAIYTEGDTSTSITTLLDIDDLDNTALTSATISMLNFSSGEDELLFTNGNGISGVFDNTVGELTLSGIASVADYQTAIRSVTYTNTSENPDNATRTISIEADDGTDKSIITTRDINVFPVNDAPTFNPSNNATVHYTEDDAPIAFTGTVSLADVDNTMLQSATITVANNIDTEDLLLFSNQGAITHTFNTATGELTLNGTATLADYKAAIESVQYKNTSQDPTAGIRNIIVTVNDGIAISNIGEREIAVKAVDDAPVIASLEASPATYTENQIAQTTITDAIALSDVDNTNLASVTITIDGMVAGDQLVYAPQGNILGSYNTSSGILELTGAATADQYASAIQSVLFLSTSEDPSNTSRNLLIEVSDGTNQTFDTREVTVIPVNDAPTGQDNTLGTDDTDSYSFHRTDFPFTDLENHAMYGVEINTLPSSGTLTLANQPVVVADIITSAQIDAGDLIFTPDENSGVTQTNFNYSVKDIGGTANNGIDTDVQPNTITINLVQINDLPVPSVESITVDEDGTQDTTTSGASSLLDNAFDADADTLIVQVTAEPQFGILTIDQNTGTFSYEHNGSEDHLDQFTYTLSDGTATVEQTVDVIVSPINDAPTANTENFADQSATFASPFSVALPISNFSDVDGDILTYTARIDDGTPQGAELPAWLSFTFDVATGTLNFSGSPTTDDVLNIVVIASDAVSSASTAMQLTINPATELQIAPALPQEEPEIQTPVNEPDSEAEATDEITTTTIDPVSIAQEIVQEPPATHTAIEVLDGAITYDSNPTISNSRDSLFASKLVEQHRNFQLKVLTDSSNLLLVQENTALADLFYTDEKTESLKKADLAEKLDDEREELENILSIDTRTIGSAVSVSTGLSIGYVIWLVRGGLLLGSVMSALPAWRNIDPLPVLSNLNDGSEDDGDSLEDMVADSQDEMASDKKALDDYDPNDEPDADRGQES